MVDELTQEDFNKYWNAIIPLEAQELLTNLTLHDFPHLKKEKRSKVHKQLHKQAFPFQHKSKPEVNFDSMREFINKNGKMIK